MSEQQFNSTEQLIDALALKNYNQAKSHFDDIMSNKVYGALEVEKVKVANTIFNGIEEDDLDDIDLDDIDLDIEEEYDDNDL
jgi:sortase (surface protein transpeptidase)